MDCFCFGLVCLVLGFPFACHPAHSPLLTTASLAALVAGRRLRKNGKANGAEEAVTSDAMRGRPKKKRRGRGKGKKNKTKKGRGKAKKRRASNKVETRGRKRKKKKKDLPSTASAAAAAVSGSAAMPTVAVNPSPAVPATAMPDTPAAAGWYVPQPAIGSAPTMPVYTGYQGMSTSIKRRLGRGRSIWCRQLEVSD